MNAGIALRRAREEAGLTQQDVIYASRQLLPKVMWLSPPRLSRIENGLIPDGNLDPFLVEFLCHIYGATISTVAPAAARSLDKYQNALKHGRFAATGCIDLRDEQPTEQLDLFDPRQEDNLDRHGSPVLARAAEKSFVRSPSVHLSALSIPA